MILIDKEQVSLDELVERFNIPLEKIQKAPVFTINPDKKVKDRLNGGFRYPVGKQFDAFFTVKDPSKGGKTVEIRYADSMNSELVGERMVDKFSPRKVVFWGEDDLKEEIDQAAYFYLHLDNRSSPFRKENDPRPWHYDFVDNEAISREKIAAIKLLRTALNHATSLTGEKLVLLAKGMGIEAVDHKEEIELQAEMMGKAQENPAKYMESVEKRTVVFDGMIQHAIDKGAFLMEETFGVKRWSWNAGPSKGVQICDVTMGQEPQLALKNHIKANINDFFGPVSNIQSTLSAESSAEAFLAKQEIVYSDQQQAQQKDKASEADMEAALRALEEQEEVKEPVIPGSAPAATPPKAPTPAPKAPVVPSKPAASNSAKK